MQIQGETINKWLYRFSTTSMLNVIEAEVINILRNKTGSSKTKSTMEILFDGIDEKKDYIIRGYMGDIYFIMDSLNGIFIYVDLTTGIVTDESMIDADFLHSSDRECEACLFLEELNQNNINWTNNLYSVSIFGGLLLDELHTPGITRYRYMCLYQITDMFLDCVDKYNIRNIFGISLTIRYLIKYSKDLEYLTRLNTFLEDPREILLHEGMKLSE